MEKEFISIRRTNSFNRVGGRMERWNPLGEKFGLTELYMRVNFKVTKNMD